MDFSNIMQMASQLRERLAAAQGEATNLRATGEAGGGMVRVVMNGRHEVVEVRIDPTLLGGKDAVFLEDLVRAATNQAVVRVSEQMRERMGGLAREFGVDPSALDMGMGPR